jgi:hypothetical protein
VRPKSDSVNVVTASPVPICDIASSKARNAETAVPAVGQRAQLIRVRVEAVHGHEEHLAARARLAARLDELPRPAGAAARFEFPWPAKKGCTAKEVEGEDRPHERGQRKRLRGQFLSPART